MQCFRATLGRKAVLLLAPVLLAVAVQGEGNAALYISQAMDPCPALSLALY